MLRPFSSMGGRAVCALRVPWIDKGTRYVAASARGQAQRATSTQMVSRAVNRQVKHSCCPDGMVGKVSMAGTRASYRYVGPVFSRPST